MTANRGLGVWILLAMAAVPGVAAAQPGADGFRPALDEHGYLTLDASQVLDPRDVSFGIGALDWGHDTLAPGAMPTQIGARIDDAMTATLVAAYGFRLGPVPLEAAVSAPFSTSSSGQGVGDVGVHLKTQIIDGQRHLVGLSVIGRLYLPTASGPDRMPGDSLTPEVGLVLDRQLGPVRLTLDGGARWIGGQRVYPIGAGAAFSVLPSKLELVAEVTDTQQQAGAPPPEGLAGVKLYLARSSYLTLGGGRALSTTDHDFRAFIGIVFEPKSGARLATRLPDPPPEVPSDRDREPPASDGDNLPDTTPGCAADPKQPGCLDPSTVIDTGSTLVTLEPINFEFDKAVIAPESHHILDVVAQTLRDNPDIKKIEIQGHTDERGNAAYNLDLSDRRAAAVVDYLVTGGIARERLTSRGYGRTKPVDLHHNEAAWAKNRRVEFVIQDRD